MRKQTRMGGVDESGVFAPIPEAVYFVKIGEVKDGYSKNGDPMIAVKFVITQGEYKDQWVWDNIVISDDQNSPGYKILGRSKHFLHIIGESYEDEIVEWDSDNWVGKELRVIVYHDTYEGKPKAKVSDHLFLEDENTIKEETPF